MLNPSMSCSMPDTSTFEALRAAAVFGTAAHACANGAAAGVASAAPAAVTVRCAAAAAVVSTSAAASAPPASQKRLCIESPSLMVVAHRPLRPARAGAGGGRGPDPPPPREPPGGFRR